MQFFKQEELSENLSPYDALKRIIKKRQEMEKINLELKPTTDINFTDIYGYSLLHYAIKMRDLKKVKLCIRNGSDTDLPSPEGPPILLALKVPQLEIAQHLFDIGADCSEIATYHVHPDLRLWFNQLLKKSFCSSFPNPKNIFYHKVKNQFFNGNFFAKKFSVIQRAVHLGDLDFIQGYIHNSNSTSFSENCEKETLLLEAVKCGNLEIVRFLLKNGASINPKKPYVLTPLLAAIRYEQKDTISYLLKHGANIYAQDNQKYSSLFYAIIRKNEHLILKLIEDHVVQNHTDVDGNNLFHCAIEAGDIKVLKILVKHIDFKKFINKENIYDRTPLDLAMQNNRTDILQLFNLNFPLLSMLKSQENLTILAQNELIKKIKYYLKTHYRNQDYFSEKGFCNGLAYLYLLYAARKKKNYFFSTLALISNWNGDEKNLKFSLKDTPQGEFYSNIDALFEQWINDITWFQHSTFGGLGLGLEQEQHQEHYEIVGDRDEYRSIVLYNEYNGKLHDQIGYNRNLKQLNELIYYIRKMPIHIRMMFGGGNHATAGYFDENHVMHYYDPNFIFKTNRLNSLEEGVQRLIDYKHILIDKIDAISNANIQLFYFQQDFNENALREFEVIPEKKLPSSQKEALEFQKKSPNHYTPLHIAVITHSITTFKKMLERNICDIHALDCFKNTVLRLVVENNFFEALVLLLKKESLNQQEVNELVLDLYTRNYNKSTKLLIDSSHFTDFAKLLQLAVKKCDYALIKKIISYKKIDMKKIGYSIMQSLVDVKSTDSNDLDTLDKIANLLLEKNINLMDTQNHTQKSLLQYCIERNEHMALRFIPTVKEINLSLDGCGNTALHIAATITNVKIMKMLIENGACINIENTDNKSIIDLLQDPWNQLDKKRTDDCFHYLFSLEKFNCFQDEETKRNWMRLTWFLKREDNKLFEIAVKKYPKNKIDYAPENEYNFLFQVVINSDCDKLEILLKAGVSINMTNLKGNTLLIILIKLKTHPKCLELIDILLKYKANVHIQNLDGETAIDLVRESEDDQLIKCFEKHNIQLGSGGKLMC